MASSWRALQVERRWIPLWTVARSMIAARAGATTASKEAQSDDADNSHDDSQCPPQCAGAYDQYELGGMWDVPQPQPLSLPRPSPSQSASMQMQPEHKRQKLGQTVIHVEAGSQLH